MSTDLLKIQSLHDFHYVPDLRFCYGNCSLLRLKFRECNSQKCDVNFQKIFVSLFCELSDENILSNKFMFRHARRL